MALKDAGQFASKDPTQNTTMNAFFAFINSLPFVVGRETALALRNDLDLGDNGQIPYLTGSVDGETTESYKDIMLRVGASQIYDAETTLIRLVVQLPVQAPPVNLDTTDRGTVQMPCGYVNVAQFQAKWAKVTDASGAKALLDSVYAGPDNQHLAEVAFPS